MSGNQGYNNKADDTIALLIIVPVVLGVILYFSYPIVKEFLLTLKLYQLQIISYIVPTTDNITMLERLKTVPAYNWTLKDSVILGNKVNYYFSPFVFLFCYVSVLIVKSKYYQAFRHNRLHIGTQSLLLQERKLWSYLEPIAHLDLLHNDVEGWESAKKPQDIAVENKLLKNKFDNKSLNRDLAAKYFASQLGPLFVDLDSLPTALKALVGVFASRMTGERDEAEFALLDISKSFAYENNGNYDFSAGLKLFEKYRNQPDLIELTKKHAYISTFFLGLFTKTKDFGVMTTKYFIWIKPMNRRLFFTLNNVGREVAWTECGGIWDHYQHEHALRRPMYKMFVNNAVDGLEEELERVNLEQQAAKEKAQATAKK